jgi:hypothetical protein
LPTLEERVALETERVGQFLASSLNEPHACRASTASISTEKSPDIPEAF